MIGLFVNPANGPVQAQIDAWPGGKVDYIVSNVGESATFDDLVKNARYIVDQIKGVALPKVIGLPLRPLREWDTLKSVAAGGGKWWFNPIADYALKNLTGDWSFSLGWEMNQTQPWAPKPGDEATYVAAYRRVVDDIRSGVTNGADVKWLWTPGITNAPKCDTFACYPGDTYVTDIGMTWYDQEWLDEARNTPQARWLLNLDGVDRGKYFGVTALLAFASARRKRLVGLEVAMRSPYGIQRLKALGIDFAWWDKPDFGANLATTPALAAAMRAA